MKTPADDDPALLSCSELLPATLQTIRKTPFPSCLQYDVHTAVGGLATLESLDDADLIRLVQQRFDQGIDGWLQAGLFTSQHQAMHSPVIRFRFRSQDP